MFINKTNEDKESIKQKMSVCPPIYNSTKMEGILFDREVELNTVGKGLVYLTLNNGKCMTIKGFTATNLSGSVILGDFLQIGDLINKQIGDNNIYVYRNNKEHRFIMN